MKARLENLFASIVISAAATCLGGLHAQDDLRDVLTMKQGAPLHGRVFARYEPDVVTVRVGERRQQVPRTDIVGMDTVRDRVREFFLLLDRLPDHLTHRWFMVQWAADHGLSDLARLTALDVVLRDPDHEGAHTLLGHRRMRGQWLWPRDGRWEPLAKLQKVRADWQHGWHLDGEHFHVQSNGDLRRVVDAVLDLERLHVVWFERFGEALRLTEVVGTKMDVKIWRDPSRFPRQSSNEHPLFYPHSGEGDVPSTAYTYFADARAARPTRLFEVATSQLLYRTGANYLGVENSQRAAPWGELGLGRYLQRCVTGPAGAAVFGAWRLDPDDARLVLGHPTRDLRHVTRQELKEYYGMVSNENAFEWAAAELSVAYILEAGGANGLRDGFFGFMQEVLREKKGSSSNVLDRHLGRPIEKVDKPWRTWIRERLEAMSKAAGAKPRVQ